MQDRTGARVALVTGADLRDGAPGGTRSYVLGLAGFLRGRGIGVDIVSNGPVEDAPEGCRIVPVTPSFRPSTVGFQKSLRRWYRGAMPRDVGLFHLHRPDDVWAMGRRGPLPPIVCTLHGDPARGIRRRRGPLLGLAYRFVEGRALALCQAIILVDGKSADAYRARYPPLAGRIHVVPNAVDARWTRTSSGGLRQDPPGGDPTFLYAGRLSVEKRVDRIIESVTAHGGPEGGRLLIAGTGPEEARLRRLASGRRVEFLDNVDTAGLARLYRRVTAVLLASEYEGLPTVALEALACGCPVIALAGGELDAILREAGGLVVDDLADLPRALERAAHMRRKGIAIGLPERFTWAHVGPQVLSIYRSVAPGAIP